MLEIELQSNETGRVWFEIIHESDLPELKSECKIFKIKILSIQKEQTPSF